jgi:hypothetical protein
MARVVLKRTDAKAGRLPHVCVRCGAPENPMEIY